MNNTRVFSLLVVLASVSLASTGPIEGLHPRITVDGTAEVRFAEGAVYVASTGVVPWVLNRQWMDLLGRSGTPFFVSWRRELADDRVRGAIAESFRMASKDRPMAEPKDWMTTFTPVRWLIDGGTVVYEWNITEFE